MDLLGVLLAEKQLGYRPFTDWCIALEEFASAYPRPAVLVTGCLDSEGSGLTLIQKCKEIEPQLRVVLWSGHDEATLAWLLAKIPVTPNARFPKGSQQEDVWKMVETIEKLARDTGAALSTGP